MRTTLIPKKETIEIKIPKEFLNKEIEIIIHPKKFNSKNYLVESLKNVDPLKFQQKMRKEWE